MKIEIRRNTAGTWSWHLISKNGKILADGGEGYARSANVRRAIREIREEILDCPIEVIPDEPLPLDSPLASPTTR